MRLVVGHAARDQPAVSLDERPRIRAPELERVGGLHVEVRVGEEGRRVRAARGRHLAENERSSSPLLDLDRPAGALDSHRNPARRPAHVVRVPGVRAHGRDCDELCELGDEGVVRRDHARDCRDSEAATPPAREGTRRRPSVKYLVVDVLRDT